MMGKKGDQTKLAITNAAISLFKYQGYHGTSVRQIAERADVNIALISYYFKNKQGILESLFIQFYEGILQTSREVFPQEVDEHEEVLPYLLRYLRALMQYYQENQEVTLLVHRELSVDSTLMREVMSTYLAKQKYYLVTLLEWGVSQGEFQIVSLEVTALQIQSLITMPYLNLQVMQEVYHLPTHSPSFQQQLLEETEYAVYALVHPSL